MLRSLALALALAAGGCTLWPWPPNRSVATDDHVEFLAKATAADGASREVIWNATLAGRPTGATAVRKALLQSLPGHSGYDLPEATRQLQTLVKQWPATDVAAIARLRLAQLRDSAGCREEVANLKRRLAAVADIERSLDRNGESDGR